MPTPRLWDRRSAIKAALVAAPGVGLAARVFADERQPPDIPSRNRAPRTLAARNSAIDLGPDVCVLTCEQTLGPCYYDQTAVRRDITEGKAGLPTSLGFLVLDADTCAPIESASIDIWHADPTGVYSAPINPMCNANDAAARSQTFLRGVQLTGSNGWAYFDTVYPGWYSGRTTHIHATVRLDGAEAVTTQFYFADELSTHIYTTNANYAPRGDKDTPNASDNVIGGSTSRVAPYTFATNLVLESSLVALKAIAVRRSGANCAA
jgi:protocatechuate 3,4-dioxygenase beta subunit